MRWSGRRLDQEMEGDGDKVDSKLDTTGEFKAVLIEFCHWPPSDRKEHGHQASNTRTFEGKRSREHILL